MTPGEIYANDRAAYKAVVGHDGWMFIWDINGLSEQVLGETQLTSDDKALLRETLLDRQRICEEVGTEYIHVVVPDKSAVYSEMLPENYRRAPRTVLEDTMEVCASVSDRVKIIDLTAWLKARKTDGRQVFLKTDSHWTNPVAFDACDYILQASDIAFDVPSIRIGVEWVERTKMFELAALLPDPVVEPFAQPFVIEPKSQIVFENLARGRGRTMVHKGPGTKKILLFRDSFSSMFTNFLAEQCERLVTINSQIFWEEIVRAEKPDLVVFQTSERFLSPVLPDSRRRSVEETFGFSLEQLAETHALTAPNHAEESA